MAWDYTKTEYKKQAETDKQWMFERLINFGLGNEKLNAALLKRYFNELKIPDDRRAFLELILWNKKF